MQFITEAIIDEVAEQLNQSEEAYTSAMEAMQAAQPILFAYPFTENFDAFTEEERAYLLYLMVIVWKVVDTQTQPAVINEQKLSGLEEANWSVIHGNKGGTFRARLDPFFEGYPQEDLLAFAEDALTQDEEEERPVVSREGQEALFVTLKTVIDSLVGYRPAFDAQ